MRLWPNKRWLGWLALLLGGAALVVVLVMLETPRAELLNQPPQPRQPRLQFLGPVRPLVRKVWLKVSPRSTQTPLVVLQGDIFECTGRFAFTNLSPADLIISNRGTRVWLVKTNALPLLGRQVEEAAEFISNAHAISRDYGVEFATIPESPFSPFGFQNLQYLMNTRGPDVDLSLFVVSFDAKLRIGTLRPSPTNPILYETNFAFGAQAIVTAGSFLLMLHDNPTNGRTAGALITTDIYRREEGLPTRPALRHKWRPSRPENPRQVL